MLSIGIVGLPNVGKSTLFNALTEKSVPAENYPFCTIDPSVGVVAVPDERLWRLSKLSHSRKTIPAAIEFTDIAGLVKGAAQGEGLGNQFLSHIRETDAIAEVVRIFEDENVLHVANRIDPLSDIEVINLELILADLQTVTKRLGNLERDAKRGDKIAIAEKSVGEKILKVLEREKLASEAGLADEEKIIAKSLHLLTMKPILYVLNKKAGAKNLDEMKDERWTKLMNFFTSNQLPVISYQIVDAGIEQELKEMSTKEREEFRKELGAGDGNGVDELIKKSYELLLLETFFTTGEDETRAWTISRGSTAPEAGAAIHTDFKDKFIRAEVVHSDKLLESGGYPLARERGRVRTEGKEYIVQDGDVIEFRI
ncbi:redox-regulated ATPase YchF [bacterium]|nr:redox-regulated ATPase YchF [bacterium]